MRVGPDIRVARTPQWQSAQIARVVRGPAGGARLEGGAHLPRNLALRPGLGIDVDVDRLDGRKNIAGAGPAQLAAQRERGGADAARADRDLEHVVEACRRLPFDDL